MAFKSEPSLPAVQEYLARPAAFVETDRGGERLTIDLQGFSVRRPAVRQALAWGLQGRVLDVGHGIFGFSVHRLAVPSK